MAMKWTWRRALGVVAVLAVAGAISGSVALRIAKKEGADAKAPVTLLFSPSDLAVVELKPIARWLPVSGALQPVKQATVKAKVSGDVLFISVREGERVQAGQTLARIDTADLEARLIERVGALESAKAQLAMAEKTRSSNQQLLKQNFISQNAFDNSESTLSVSQGTVKSAEAQVQMARIALKDATVVSPLAGIVAKRHVQQGEKVAFDSPLVTVVDLKEMELQAMVPAADVPELSIGMPVALSIDGFGERRFAGRVERINPATETGTRAILVYVGIPNADSTLRGGMFATGRIALSADKPTPTLPQAAIRTEAGQTYIWAIEGGKLGRRIVTVGRRDDESGVIEIKTALAPDLKILANRFDNLKDGAPAMVRAPTGDKAKAG
jgi:membrane fusion protein (multidrug efflux system)